MKTVCHQARFIPLRIPQHSTWSERPPVKATNSPACRKQVGNLEMLSSLPTPGFCNICLLKSLKIFVIQKAASCAGEPLSSAPASELGGLLQKDCNAAATKVPVNMAATGGEVSCPSTAAARGLRSEGGLRRRCPLGRSRSVVRLVSGFCGHCGQHRPVLQQLTVKLLMQWLPGERG